MLLGVGGCTSAPSTAEGPAITVDLASRLGPVTYGASGSLFAVSEDGTPAGDKLSGIKLRGTGQMAPGGLQHPDGDANEVAGAFFRQGGEELMVYIQDSYAGFPYPEPGIDAYLDTVTKVVDSIKDRPDASKYVLVPFNEPDTIWYSSSGLGLVELQDDWKTVHDRIRSLWPEARIAGPSFFHYSPGGYRSFYAAAKATDTLPDVTTWHELSDDFFTDWYGHIADYRAIEDEVGITDLPVNVNEYGRPKGDMGVPGRMIQYIARFDASRVNADMASWDLIGDIGQTLTRDFDKAATWYLYRWYGERTGASVRVTPPSRNGDLQATASLSGTGRQATVLLGGAGGSADVVIRGFGAAAMGSSVHVVVSRLASTGRGPSSGPTTVSEADVAVAEGRVTVPIRGMRATDAYQVRITSGSGDRFDPNRRYRLTNAGNGTALAGLDEGTVDGSSVGRAASSRTGAEQRWYLVAEGGGLFKLVNGYSGRSLAARRSTDGTAASLRTWTSARDQLWRIEDRGDGRVSIVDRETGAALGVADGAVVRSAFTGAAGQLWTVG